MKKHKNKFIITAAIIAILGIAFWWGGDAPGSRGLNISSPLPKQEISLEATPMPESDVNNKPINTPSENPSESMEGFSDETKGKDTVEKKVEITSETIKTNTESEKKVDEIYSENKEIDTEKDKYLTEPSPKGKPVPLEPEDAVITDKELTATLAIRCDTILDDISWLDTEKVELVPEDGVIFAEQEVIFYEGESVFNVLLREMKKNKIHFEFVNTPIYNSAYIEGIANIYEFDCGELSGWAYKVNNWFPNYGSSRYGLKDGDKIEWLYTCDLGTDIGGYNSLTGE